MKISRHEKAIRDALDAVDKESSSRMSAEIVRNLIPRDVRQKPTPEKSVAGCASWRGSIARWAGKGRRRCQRVNSMAGWTFPSEGALAIFRAGRRVVTKHFTASRSMSLRDWFGGTQPSIATELWSIWCNKGTHFDTDDGGVIATEEILRLEWRWHYADAMRRTMA